MLNWSKWRTRSKAIIGGVLTALILVFSISVTKERADQIQDWCAFLKMLTSLAKDLPREDHPILASDLAKVIHAELLAISNNQVGALKTYTDLCNEGNNSFALPLWLHRKGFIEKGLGKWTDAEATFRKAVIDVEGRKNPLYEALEIVDKGLIADVLLRRGQAEQAIAIYLSNIPTSELWDLRVQPKSYSLHQCAFRSLEICYAELGRKDDFVLTCQQALNAARSINNEPEITRCLVDLGVAYYRNNQLVEAEEYYKKALSREPDNARTLSFLAGASAGLNQYSDAINYSSRAIELDRNQTYAWQTRAFVYDRLGSTKLCISDLTEAITHQESFFESRISNHFDSAQSLASNYLHRGDAFLKLNLNSEAVSDYNKALKLVAGPLETNIAPSEDAKQRLVYAIRNRLSVCVSGDSHFAI